ncbi:MAG: hypothetical protein Q7S47_00950 [bacterium]|nr:hypothetical protein [bacterium]
MRTRIIVSACALVLMQAMPAFAQDMPTPTEGQKPPMQGQGNGAMPGQQPGGMPGGFGGQQANPGVGMSPFPGKISGPFQGPEVLKGFIIPGNGVPCPQGLDVCSGMTQEEADKYEADQQKRQEGQMKKQQEQQMKMMKQGAQQALKGIANLKKQISRQEGQLKKCGVGMPQEVVSAIADADALAGKIGASSDVDELQELMQDMQYSMQTVGESQQQFGMLQGMCQMLPQATKMFTQADKKFKAVVKTASKNKSIDISDLTADYQVSVDSLKMILAQVKETMTTDPEGAMQSLQEDFFQGFNEVFQKIGNIKAVSQSAKGVTALDKSLANFKKQRDKLSKKGSDVAELSDAIGLLESSIIDLKDIRKTKGFDPQDMMSAFEDAFSAIEDVASALDDLGVQTANLVPKFGPMNTPKFDIPQFSGGTPSGMGQPNQGGPQMGGKMPPQNQNDN